MVQIPSLWIVNCRLGANIDDINASTYKLQPARDEL